MSAHENKPQTELKGKSIAMISINYLVKRRVSKQGRVSFLLSRCLAFVWKWRPRSRKVIYNYRSYKCK